MSTKRGLGMYTEVLLRRRHQCCHIELNSVACDLRATIAPRRSSDHASNPSSLLGLQGVETHSALSFNLVHIYYIPVYFSNTSSDVRSLPPPALQNTPERRKHTSPAVISKSRTRCLASQRMMHLLMKIRYPSNSGEPLGGVSGPL